MPPRLSVGHDCRRCDRANERNRAQRHRTRHRVRDGEWRPGDGDDIEHVIATTQMQATDCRRAFPCWDEPEFKAVFSITLVIDPALAAVSNSPEIGREERPGGPDG